MFIQYPKLGTKPLPQLNRHARQRRRAGHTLRHKAGQTFRHKAGQTLVEYILVCSVVVGGLAVFKEALLKPLVTLLTGTTAALQEEATQGGERNLSSYYINSCAGTDKPVGCQ